MTQLETTIIAIARQELDCVASFYSRNAQEDVTDEEWQEHLSHYHGLNTMLMLGHLADSGMSTEGAKALREIEDEHLAAYRALVARLGLEADR